MDESEYGSIRLSLAAFLDTMSIPLKIDISTGDQITPAEISFQYKLMFEERYISVWAYNLETVLAEKLEAILVRGTLNTRLRDFYDVHILQNRGMQINLGILSAAIRATCKKRGSEDVLLIYRDTLDQIECSAAMRNLWKVYQLKTPMRIALLGKRLYLPLNYYVIAAYPVPTVNNNFNKKGCATLRLC